MDSYVVVLSAIGATNQNWKSFFCKFVENTRKKNVFFFRGFLEPDVTFSHRFAIFITGAPFTNKWAAIWRF